MESIWIPVEHAKPKETEVVLVWLPFDGEFGLRTLAYLYGGEWYAGTKPLKSNVTHWAQLPEPPKNKKAPL